MRVTRSVLVAALAVVALAIGGCGGDDDEAAGNDTTGAPAQPGDTLMGSVGPGFEISLTTKDGQDVTSLVPGSYTIEVDDKADIHNFHLRGPGVDDGTSVEEVGQQTFELDLGPGTYTYVCDPHASSMSGSFEVAE